MRGFDVSGAVEFEPKSRYFKLRSPRYIVLVLLQGRSRFGGARVSRFRDREADLSWPRGLPRWSRLRPEGPRPLKIEDSEYVGF